MIKNITYLNLMLLSSIILNNNIISMKKESVKQEFCLLDMPGEILILFVESIIQSYINNWDDIFSFSGVKEEIEKNIISILLINKEFYSYKSFIVNIAERLMAEKSKYLKNQIKDQIKAKYGDLSQKALNLKLIKILDKYRFYLSKNIREDANKKAFTLILAGADVNVKNKSGNTFLIRATEYGYKDIVELLILLAKANVNVEYNSKYSALHLAILLNHDNIAKLLINAYANVNTKGENGVTALMSAALHSGKGLVKLLIQSGADINAKDDNGETALMTASFRSFRCLVELFIQAGADINVKDNMGNTALMCAIKFNLGDYGEDTVELLVANGADINVKNNDGESALMLATRNYSVCIVELLKSKIYQERRKKGRCLID